MKAIKKKLYKFDNGPISSIEVERLPATEFTTPHEIITFYDDQKLHAGSLFMRTGSAAKLAKALALFTE